MNQKSLALIFSKKKKPKSEQLTWVLESGFDGAQTAARVRFTSFNS